MRAWLFGGKSDGNFFVWPWNWWVTFNAQPFLHILAVKFVSIPVFGTVSYGKQSLRYLWPELWNDTFKTGLILISDIQKKNIPICKIKTIHNFKNALKILYLYLYSTEWFHFSLFDCSSFLISSDNKQEFTIIYKKRLMFSCFDLYDLYPVDCISWFQIDVDGK